VNAEPATGRTFRDNSCLYQTRSTIHINVSFRPSDADGVNDVLQKIASASSYDTRRTSLLGRCDSERWTRDRCGLLPWLNKL